MSLIGQSALYIRYSKFLSTDLGGDHSQTCAILGLIFLPVKLQSHARKLETLNLGSAMSYSNKSGNMLIFIL
jgi:hypothetical protein